MRKLTGVAAACAVALAVPASSQAIVNGTPDGNAHPNVGALTDNFQGSQVLACTGTLISPTVMVTAAHCTAQLQQLGFKTTDVTFDSNIGTGSDQTCGLTDCVVETSKTYTGTLHTDPDFTGSTSGNDSHDIAVVTFAKPIKGITPAQLPSAGLLDQMSSAGTFASATFTEVGYGWHAVVSASKNFSGLFDGVRRSAVSGSRALNTSEVKMSENASLGFGGACSHDSGGPDFLGNGNTIVGELSALQGACSGTYDDYRLDTDSARAFLAQYVTLP